MAYFPRKKLPLLFRVTDHRPKIGVDCGANITPLFLYESRQLCPPWEEANRVGVGEWLLPADRQGLCNPAG
jgi:hypothetical protein